MGLLTVVVLQERPQPPLELFRTRRSPRSSGTAALNTLNHNSTWFSHDPMAGATDDGRVRINSKTPPLPKSQRSHEAEKTVVEHRSTSQTSTLQCVFKLSSTHVTPAAPDFPGPRAAGRPRSPGVRVSPRSHHHLPGGGLEQGNQGKDAVWM